MSEEKRDTRSQKRRKTFEMEQQKRRNALEMEKRKQQEDKKEVIHFLSVQTQQRQSKETETVTATTIPNIPTQAYAWQRNAVQTEKVPQHIFTHVTKTIKQLI